MILAIATAIITIGLPASYVLFMALTALVLDMQHDRSRQRDARGLRAADRDNSVTHQGG